MMVSIESILESTNTHILMIVSDVDHVPIRASLYHDHSCTPGQVVRFYDGDLVGIPATVVCHNHETAIKNMIKYLRGQTVVFELKDKDNVVVTFPSELYSEVYK